MQNPSQSICRFRWNYPLVNLQTAEVRTCCHTTGQFIEKTELDELKEDVFLNTPYQIARRKEMLEGIRHPSCDYCWKMEDNGINSPRHKADSFTEYFNKANIPGDFNTLVDKIKKDPSLLKSDRPYLLEIILGNLCDLKCVYCSDVFSSAWEMENKTFVENYKPTTRQTAPADFIKYFWSWFEKNHSSLEFISFIGGEPTLSSDFYVVLEKLVQLYKNKPKEFQRPTLGIITNLNSNDLYLKRFIDYLPTLTEHFTVLLFASVDTVGTRAEYIRKGLNWDKFVKNAHRILEMKLPNLHFSINPSINVLSVTTMIDLLKWIKDLQDQYQTPIGIGRNMVVAPEYYSPLNLTPNFAGYMQECVQFVKANIDPKYPVAYHGDWNLFVDFLSGIESAIRSDKADVSKQKLFIHRIMENDRRRKSNFISMFPEYEQYLEHCQAVSLST